MPNDSDDVAAFLRYWLVGPKPGNYSRNGQRGLTSLVLGSCVGATTAMALIASSTARRARAETVKRLAAMTQGIQAVQSETVKVERAVQRMADETTRAQILALKVGVATAVLAAIFGGVVGALATRVIGG